MRDATEPVILVVLAVGVVAFLLGVGYGKFVVKQQAVQAGVAEYQCDPQTGNTYFVFKEAK